MAERSLQCPCCGAPASLDDHWCAYCGSPLATATCPSCFGKVFRGNEYCHHCGTQIQQAQVIAEGEPCPRCDQQMMHTRIGEAQASECAGCGGLWIDSSAFERICADRQRQAAVLAAELPPPTPDSVEGVRFYLSCPICGATMNRTNFAGHSGVVIDICKSHGIWFDREELRRIIQFIRAGGIDKARKRELEKLEREREKLERARAETPSLSAQGYGAFGYGGQDETVDLVRTLGSIIRFAVR